MVAERRHLFGELGPDRPLQPRIVQERNVLRPGEADHDAKPVVRRFVEHVAPWRRVRPDRVDAEAGHQLEVVGDLRGGWELMAVRVGRKGTVRHALDEEAFVAGAQKFPVPGNSLGRCRCGSALKDGAGLDCGFHKSFTAPVLGLERQPSIVRDVGVAPGVRGCFGAGVLGAGCLGAVARHKLRVPMISRAGVRSPVQLMRLGASRNRTANPNRR